MALTSEVDCSRLVAGMVVKNYKELCTLVNEPIMAGDSKRAQVENWGRFFDFSREGHKYIIHGIHEVPDTPKINKSPTYILHMEFLLMCSLINMNEYTASYSRGLLYSTLGMINGNFDKYHDKDTRKEVEELFKTTRIRTWEVNHFLFNAKAILKDYLFRALDSMRGRGVISYIENTIIVDGGNTENDDIVHRQATENDIEIIKETRQQVLNEMGFKIIPLMKTWEFYHKVNNILKDERGWLYTYPEIRIAYTPLYMPKNVDYTMLSEERRDIMKDVNTFIIDKVNEKAKARFKKNQKEVKQFNKEHPLLELAEGEKLPFDYKGESHGYLKNQEKLAEIFLRI